MVTEKQLANLRPFQKGHPSLTPKRPRGKYLTSFLKRCLSKKIDYEDPDTQQILHGKVRDALVWRLIMNATQGETDAIKEVFNRIEGKINGGLEGVDFGENNHIVLTNINVKEMTTEKLIEEVSSRLSRGADKNAV
jgi:translation elongation factor EF-1beta